MKRIILLITIILLVFSMGSCQIADWMLGTIYSMDKRGDNNIYVDVALGSNIDVTNHPVIIALIPIFVTNTTTMQTEIAFDKIVKEKFWGQIQIHWEFRGLASNSYRVIAFHDANDDGNIQVEEYSVSFERSDMLGQEVFDFTKDNAPTEMNGNAFLSDYPAIEASFLQKLTNAASIAAFNITGKDALDSRYLGYETFYIESNSPDLSLISYTWDMVYTDSRDIIITIPIYNQMDYSLMLDLASAYPTLNGQTTRITLIINGIFKVASTGAQKPLKAEHTITLAQDDPTFWLEGPGSIPRDGTGVYSYMILRSNTKTINSIEYRIVDNYCNTVGLNSNWGWTAVENPSMQMVSINTSQLYPALTDSWWSSDKMLVLEVNVYYADNTSYYSSYWVALNSVVGSFYDLKININTLVYNGYCDIFVNDYSAGNTLVSTYVYLDGFGEGTANFWGIQDPAGLDQTLRINFYEYDSFTYSYTLIGYAEQYLTGPLSGLITKNISDGDIITP